MKYCTARRGKHWLNKFFFFNLFVACLSCHTHIFATFYQYFYLGHNRHSYRFWLIKSSFAKHASSRYWNKNVNKRQTKINIWNSWTTKMLDFICRCTVTSPRSNSGHVSKWLPDNYLHKNNNNYYVQHFIPKLTWYSWRRIKKFLLLKTILFVRAPPPTHTHTLTDCWIN